MRDNAWVLPTQTTMGVWAYTHTPTHPHTHTALPEYIVRVDDLRRRDLHRLALVAGDLLEVAEGFGLGHALAGHHDAFGALHHFAGLQRVLQVLILLADLFHRVESGDCRLHRRNKLLARHRLHQVRAGPRLQRVVHGLIVTVCGK